MTNYLSTTNPAQGARIVTNHESRNFWKHAIYLFLIVTVKLLFALPLSATIYYVSATGSDANSGTSTSTPWCSLTKLNNFTPKPGDQILFKRGDTWHGTIIVKASGTNSSPIVYGAWGDGINPVISGFVTLSGWNNEGNGIYSKTLTADSKPEIVTVNVVKYQMGNMPINDRKDIN